MNFYSLSAIGETAYSILHRTREAAVMGLTSRGVFCSTGDGQIIFISYENWRGPLTANLALDTELDGNSRFIRKEERSHPQAFDRLAHASVVKLFADRILFEVEDLTIFTKSISPWTTNIYKLQKNDLSAAQGRLTRTTRSYMTEGNGEGWIKFIPRWAGFEINRDSQEPNSELDKDLLELANSLRAGDGKEILSHTERLSGRGSGLTPSGDDFLVGLLLGLHATAELSPIFDEVDGISQHLIQQARQKTTSLSANLIACAVDGQADERLESALNGILSGELPEAECARRLADYGSSSGGDALLGMAMALSLV